jgi:transcription initiation factor IIE alpha subunit
MNFNQILQHMFPRTRNTDPITSYEAADKVDFAGEHIEIILECLAKHGALGKDGIASRTNLDGNQVARRLNEMMKLGFIELTGNTVKSKCNRNEREWRLKEKE